MTRSPPAHAFDGQPLPNWVPLAVFALLAFHLLSLLVPEPRFFSVSTLLLLSMLRPLSLPFWVTAVASWAVLLLPALVAFLATWLVPKARLIRWVRGVTGFVVALAALDLPAQMVMSALTTEAAASVRLLIALTLLAWAILLRSLAMQALGRSAGGWHPMRWLSVAVILTVCLWSWAVFAAALHGALRITGDDPYCIADTHDDARDYRPIGSILALRGSHLYTDRTGYKDSSRWFFNALLLVQRKEGVAFYAWSYSAWRFEPLRSQRFIVPIADACSPEPGFLLARLWPWRR
ncbi:hypothetical protein [Falsiroseomonas sp.]|uniref:hypothetical protein n=1 Tax=Falsiroseomonas sp. TaxID=2870721 RepID=UPI003564F9EC